MSKHTPGPWRLEGPDNFSYHLTDQNGEHIAHLNKSRYVDNRQDLEAGANARLIAAAPEMYDTLKNIRSYITASCPDAYGVKTVIGKLDTLLAKIDATNSPEKGKGG